ncbi:MAG TPA: hypothetical protein VFW07_14875 [Parafilimonas sp.]|nr:hypothetical protein [Parafilimonas sp.]
MYKNPPRALLVEMVDNINIKDFETKYGIGRDSLIQLLNKNYIEFEYTKSQSDSSDYIVTNFNPDTAYFYDALGVFRKRPGDCGWSPNTIMYKELPGKESDVREFIKKNNFKIEAFTENEYTDTSSDGFKLMDMAIKNQYYYILGDYIDFYYSRAISVGSFEEDDVIQSMQASGLFLYVSREAIPCGSYYTRLVIQKKFVFKNYAPSRMLGISFLQSFFKSELNGNCTIKITPISDFSYDISLLGLSKYLALKKKDLWEKFTFTIFFQNGFDCAPDEMEVMIQLGSFKFAKGSESQVPPLVRFSESNSDDFFQSSQQASDFARDIFNLMANKCNGKFLSSASFNN